jgi:hypothetical protein
MMACQHSLPAGSTGSPRPRAARLHNTEGVTLISGGSHRRSAASSQGAYAVALRSVIGGAQWRLSGESAVQRRPNGIQVAHYSCAIDASGYRVVSP